jgi:hypothetical protein
MLSMGTRTWKIEEHGVLVDFLAVDVHEALADGLDEADAGEAGLERAV